MNILSAFPSKLSPVIIRYFIENSTMHHCLACHANFASPNYLIADVLEACAIY